jgi:hypothetical protein
MNTLNCAWDSQLNHAPIIPRYTTTARLPASHPLTVIIVFVNCKYGWIGIEHPFLWGKNSSEVSIAFAPKRGSAKLIDCFAQAGILNDLDCSIENSAMIN